VVAALLVARSLLGARGANWLLAAAAGVGVGVVGTACVHCTDGRRRAACEVVLRLVLERLFEGREKAESSRPRAEHAPRGAAAARIV
jgi:hypothetical protein